MARQLGRREFFQDSAGLLAAGTAIYNPAGNLIAREIPQTPGKDSEAYKVKWYGFSEYPDADSCWSLSVGPDGRIYAAADVERVPGGGAKVVRYNEDKDGLDYLLSVDQVVDDPGDSGRAPQCKIHYGFVPSMHDGILYMATHDSAPPADQPAYSPWLSWHDEKRCFRGSALIAFDTKTDEVKWWDTMIPKEGSRCLLHDEDRGLLYSVSYPRDHLISYDLKKRERRDIGRIGSVNAQALFLDRRHRVWTSSDYGHLVRYDPEKDRLELSPSILPHNPVFQTGWHSVFYDVAGSPDGNCVYASTWVAQPRLMRIWPNEGEWPKVEDLGSATQVADPTYSTPTDMELDHCGGLVFAGDGQLYFVAARWRGFLDHPLPLEQQERTGVVWRMNPETLQRQEVARLVDSKGWSPYVSRGAVDHRGDLFFGFGGSQPGIFKVEMPEERKKENAHLPLRMWG